MRTVIFDLDNCLSDDEWRIPRIRWDLSVEAGRYDAYHAVCGEDALRNLSVVRAAAERFDGVAFCTARPEKVRTQTLDWLVRMGLARGTAPTLLMRRNVDHRPGRDVKHEQLRQLRESMHDVIGAYDDRDDILEMYRLMGVPCVTKMQIHSTCAYTPPTEALDARHDPDLQLLDDPIPVDAAPEQPQPYVGRRPTHALLDELSSPQHTAADVLAEMAETFRERNKVYGSNFRMVAPLVKILWPDGVPRHVIEDDSWHLFELILVKLSRFAISNLSHQDSIHDTAVYAAMIEANLLEKQ